MKKPGYLRILAILMVTAFAGGMLAAQGAVDDLDRTDLVQGGAGEAALAPAAAAEAAEYAEDAADMAEEGSAVPFRAAGVLRRMAERKGNRAFGAKNLPEAQLNHADDGGVLIADVFSDSPADKAGILRGDILMAVDGEEVSSIADIGALLVEYEHGETVVLSLVRGGEAREVSLTLETRIGRPLIGIVGSGAGPEGGVHVPRMRGDEYPMPGFRAPGRDFSDRLGNSRERLRDGAEELQDRMRERMFENRLAPDQDADELDRDEDSDDSEGIGTLPDLLSAGNAAYIAEVSAGSPAEAAGITSGSFVLALEGKELVDGDLASAVRQYAPGDTVSLRLWFEGAFAEVSVILGRTDDGKALLGVSYYPLESIPRLRDQFLDQMPGGNQFRGRTQPQLPDTRDN